jgi:hypothetical protein
MFQFPFPPTLVLKGHVGSINRHRESRFEQAMGDLAYGLVPCPAVHLFCTAIPEGESALHVPDENGIVGELEQIGLSPECFCALLYSPLQFIAGRFTFGDVRTDTGHRINVAMRITEGKLCGEPSDTTSVLAKRTVFFELKRIALLDGLPVISFVPVCGFLRHEFVPLLSN